MDSLWSYCWCLFSSLTSVIIAGFMLHVLTATCIGIIAGLFLYKTNILNISRPSNGLKYGLFVGSLVFVIFAIAVQEFVLGPEFALQLIVTVQQQRRLVRHLMQRKVLNPWLVSLQYLQIKLSSIN